MAANSLEADRLDHATDSKVSTIPFQPVSGKKTPSRDKPTIGNREYPRMLATLVKLKIPVAVVISVSKQYIAKHENIDNPYMYPKCALFPAMKRHTARTRQNVSGPARSLSRARKSESSARLCARKGFRTAKVFSIMRSG